MAGKKTFWEPVRVRSAYFDQDMAKAKRSERAILLSPNYGFVDPDFSRLRKHTWLRDLDLYDTKITENDGLDGLRGLESLSLRSVPNKLIASLDCAWYPKLKSLAMPCVRRFRWPSEDSPLGFLSISRYRPKSNDLTELPAWRHLTCITIFGGGGLHSLCGIGRFPRLDTLVLLWIRNLDSLRHIGDAPRLKTLELDCCPRVASLEGIEECARLEHLNLSKCRSLKSILPAARLPRIKRICVMSTPVPKSEREHFARVPDCTIMPTVSLRDVRENLGDVV